MGNKKAAPGAVLMILTAAAALAALVLYIQNCKTNYFMNLGTDQSIVVCLAVCASAEILMVILSAVLGAKPYLDILPVIAGVCAATATVRFIGSRIAGAASIMTFENNAENMADLNAAIVAMAVCAAAMFCVMISSFFKAVKD